MPVSVIYKTATILAGQSLSSPIDCTTGAPIIIFIPHEWTPSHLTFQVSADGSSFYDLFDHNTFEVALNAVPGTCVRLGPGWTGLFFKLRSGSREHPIAQEADRQIVIMLDTSATPAPRVVVAEA
jgi:hypothetical protein